MKTRIAAVLMIIICICLGGGCAKDNKSVEENFSYVDVMRLQVKDEGCYYIDGYTEQMKFYDFKLDKSIPICDKPNCRHNSSDCNAYLQAGFNSGVGCYRGKLYFFDVMDPKLPLYQCDKNGTNRKVVANIIEEEKHRSYSIQLPMYFVENELFFEVTETRVLTEPVQKDDGTVQTYDMYWMLAKINLDTGKFELVKEPELTPETGVVQTCGYRNGNIIYVINDYKAKASLYEFDIKTEKAELIWAFGKDEYAIDDESYESGKLFYYNWKGEGNKSRVYAIDIDTKKKELVVEKDIPEGKIYEWRDLLGDSFVYILYDEDAEDFEEKLEGELVEYNWKDRTEKKLTKDEFLYRPRRAAKDWYVTFTPEKGYVAIPKKAYEKKDWSKIQVIGFI